MTKPTKSTTSEKSGDKPSDQTAAKQDTTAETKSEALKLKKEAAKPDSIASRDIGAGTGADAAAGGGDVKPVESTLVGKIKDGAFAAEAKDKPAETKTTLSGPFDKAQADKPKETSITKDGGTTKAAATASSSAATSAKSATPAQSATVQKTGFWQLVSGGVVAAGIGAAATIWALPHLPEGWLPEDQTQQAAIDVEAIKAEAVAAAEYAARKIVEETAPVSAPVGDIQAALDTQEERIAALETAAAKVTASAEQTPAETPATALPPVTDGNLQQVVAQLQKQVESQAAQIGELASRPALDPEDAAKVQALAERVDTAQQEISAAQAETAKLQAAAQDSTKRAEAVAAVAALQAALERGVTPEETRQKLEEVGINAPEALTKEVPSLESLQSGFGDASRSALRVTRTGENAESGNRFTNFLRTQTGARSVEPREGDDPDAILSRANANVENGDIAAALEEMAALPDAAKAAPAMAEWLSGANTYRDAAAALSDMSATNN